MDSNKTKMKASKTLRIEIGKSYLKGKWRIRIGDIAGSIERSNISKEEVLEEIGTEMEELDDTL